MVQKYIHRYNYALIVQIISEALMWRNFRNCSFFCSQTLFIINLLTYSNPILFVLLLLLFYYKNTAKQLLVALSKALLFSFGILQTLKSLQSSKMPQRWQRCVPIERFRQTKLHAHIK